MSKAYIKLTNYKLRIEKYMKNVNNDNHNLNFKLYSQHAMINDYFETALDEWDIVKMMIKTINYKTINYDDLFNEKLLDLYSLFDKLSNEYLECSSFEQDLHIYFDRYDVNDKNVKMTIKILELMQRFLYKIQKYIIICIQKIDKTCKDYDEIVQDIEYDSDN